MSRPLKRMMECPLRRPQSCGDVDAALGWIDAMPLDRCDMCHALGGPYTPESVAWRQQYADGVVRRVLQHGLEHYPQAVVLTILGKHLEPAAAEAERARLASLPGETPTRRGLHRWLGVWWEGVPWPKRPVICGLVAARSFLSTWNRLSAGGCGCIKRVKDLWEAAKA